MNLDQTWQSTLNEMELQVSRANFVTWLKKSVLLDQRDGIFTVALPNSFAKEWVESKYAKNILGIIRNIDSSVKKIDFVIAPNLFENNNNEKQTVKNSKQNQIGFEFSKIDPETNLNPRYTLDSFVVGSSNELAYSAATAIIKEIGVKYNPLFIYGGVGLGKTHLIQAIGNEIKNNFKNQVKVKYVTSEKFTNDVVTAIRNKRMEDIKKKYRNVDVLIIDDIQFIGGKAATEEEFFHTFNALHENNKQIIISADRPPQSLPILGERLNSRFQAGLSADITFPEYEMRVAIIRNRLSENNQYLDSEMVDLIAQRVKKNIRELEGVLKQIFLYHETKKIELNRKNIEEIIEKTTRDSSSKITAPQILKGVSHYFNISLDELIGQSRKKEYVEPRQIAMYFLRDILNMSYPSIGEKLGKRDHTTIIHGCEKIGQEINKNAALNQKIFSIRETINKIQ